MIVIRICLPISLLNLALCLWGATALAQADQESVSIGKECKKAGGDCEAAGQVPSTHTKDAPAARVTKPQPPAFQNVRVEEDWSALREQKGLDLTSRIKFIPLNSSGSVFLSLGGQLRVRSETWSNFGFSASDQADDTFGLSRLRLHGDLHLGQRMRIFVEGKSALGDGRTLPGGLRTLDVDSADFQQALLDLNLALEPVRFTLRVGRQELQFGRERLVSPLDWSNTRPRSFDGFRGILETKSWRVDGFWSKHVLISKYSLNSSDDSGTGFFGIYASGKKVVKGLDLDLYWLGIERDRATFLGTAAGEERQSLGTRLGGPLPVSGLTFEVEGAYQLGDFGKDDIEASMFTAEAGYAIPSLPFPFRVYTGFDFASGDGDPADGTLKTFNQLFPLGHAYLGFADFVGRQNIVDWRQGFSLVPFSALTLATDLHHFWRASRADALYDAGGGVVRRGSPDSSKRVGIEVDVTAKWRPDRHYLVEVGYSYFFARDFLRETGPSEGLDFVYVLLQYTF